MFIAIISITLFAHILLPLLFLWWIFKSKASNKLHWLTIVTLAGSYILFMWPAGADWGMFGFYWPWIFIALFILIVLFSSFKRINYPWFPKKSFKGWGVCIFLMLLAGLFLTSLPSAFSARKYPKEQAIQLLFPLTGGQFHITHGGSNEGMNQHYTVPAQKYAIDVQQLNRLGIRANGLMPTTLSKFAVFGTNVVAPCTGEVLSSETNLTDLTPPNADSENLLGNHVILYCQDASVLLAHLKHDSVKAKKGDIVQQGSIIGQVGNTGHTTEPHLHIHAVSGKHFVLKEIAGTAEGIPMIFDNKFLIRNDRVVKQ